MILITLIYLIEHDRTKRIKHINLNTVNANLAIKLSAPGINVF